MNEFEQPDPMLEQSLRAHYHVSFRNRYGSAPTTTELWQQVSDRLTPGVSAHPWWQRFVPHARETTQRAIPSTPLARRPARTLVIAATLLFALLVVSGAVYAGGTLWIDRVVQSDPGTQGLDFTTINLTKTVDGNTVYIQKVYADANNVLIAYTSHKDATTVVQMDATLRVSHGTTLPSLSGLNTFYDPLGKKADGSVSLYTFDARSIQGNPQALSLDLQLTPAYLIPLPQGTISPKNQGTPGAFHLPQRATGAPLTFTFTLPFHSGKVVSVNKTVVSHGHALTLNRVVIAPSETRVYVTSADGEPLTSNLVVGGWNYQSESGLKARPGSDERGIVFNPSTTKGPTSGFWTLQGQTGTWSLKVTQIYGSSGPIAGDWQFTFLVS